MGVKNCNGKVLEIHYFRMNTLTHNGVKWSFLRATTNLRIFNTCVIRKGKKSFASLNLWLPSSVSSNNDILKFTIYKYFTEIQILSKEKQMRWQKYLLLIKQFHQSLNQLKPKNPKNGDSGKPKKILVFFTQNFYLTLTVYFRQ